jgi:hypothetical protein
LSAPPRLIIWGLAGLGTVVAVWLGYSVVRDSPGFCFGAPPAYGRLRTVPLRQRSAALLRLTIAERVAVYEADQRCGRPSHLSLDTLIGDRDSTTVRELVGALDALRTAEDTSVLVQLLAHVKCVHGVRVEIDSGSAGRLTTTIAGMPDGSWRNSGIAALNRVAGKCRP